jgi:hypothetical protein
MGKSRMLPIAIVVLFVAATVGAALGVMSVQVKNGQLRSSPSFLASPVAPVAYCDQVELLQQQGDWMEVNAPGAKKGWIHQSALTKKKMSMGAGGKDPALGASGDEVALAGKGFNADVEKKFRADHRSTDFMWVDKMELMKVSPEEMVAFLRDGGVKPQAGGAK